MGRSLRVFNQRATMPESHKAEKKRMQKANREAGIGDESGRIVRVKDEKPKGVFGGMFGGGKKKKKAEKKSKKKK